MLNRSIASIFILFLCFVLCFSVFSEEEEKIDIDRLSRSFDADDELYIVEELETFRDKDKPIKNIINFSGGNLIITPSPKRGILYSGSFWYETVFHSPAFEINEKPDKYEINLRQRRSRIYLAPSSQRRPIWKYNIPSDIETSFDISLSGSNTLIELGDMHIRNAEISARGQETAILFSKPNKRILEELRISANVGKLSIIDLLNSNTAYTRLSLSSGSYYLDFGGNADMLTERTVDIRLNAARIDIHLSRDVGYEIYTSTLVSISAPGLIRNEDYHRTQNFQEADRKIFINIRGVAGRVNITY